MATRRESQSAGLSRERILAAALGVADLEGIDALSMRRLAQELDVWPMSIYRYFQDKDALLDAMAADALSRIAPPDTHAPWRDRLVALLDEARRAISRSPGIAPRLPGALLTGGALGLPEAGMAVLSGAGFTSAEAASAWRALWSYTFGFATSAAPSARSVRAAIAAAPEDSHPALEAAADELADALAEDEQFRVGLDRLLDGFEARRGASASRA